MSLQVSAGFFGVWRTIKDLTGENRVTKNEKDIIICLCHCLKKKLAE